MRVLPVVCEIEKKKNKNVKCGCYAAYQHDSLLQQDQDRMDPVCLMSFLQHEGTTQG
jgi:hypothetical protein